MKRNLTQLLSVLLTLLVSACASSGPPPSLHQQLAAQAQNQPLPAAAVRQLAFHAYQQQQDDVYKQAWWLLCQDQVMRRRNGNDCQQSLDVAIVYGDNTQASMSAVALFFISGDEVYLKTAQVYADAADKASIAELASPSLAQCASSDLQAVYLAWHCYQAGKASMDKLALGKALALYQQFGALRNQADTLFLLAQVAFRDDQVKQAIKLAANSAALLTQVGDVRQAAVVRQWRTERLHD